MRFPRLIGERDGESLDIIRASLRRRNVGMLFSRKDNLKCVLIKYKISTPSCLQTIHPKKCAQIFLRRRLPCAGRPARSAASVMDPVESGFYVGARLPQINRKSFQYGKADPNVR